MYQSLHSTTADQTRDFDKDILKYVLSVRVYVHLFVPALQIINPHTWERTLLPWLPVETAVLPYQGMPDFAAFVDIKQASWR